MIILLILLLILCFGGGGYSVYRGAPAYGFGGGLVGLLLLVLLIWLLLRA